jgi:hypothetical protein
MIGSEVADFARDIGLFAGAVAAVVTSIGVLTRVRAVRWLWRRVVSQPLDARARLIVGEEVDKRVDPVKAELAALRKENTEQHTAMRDRLDQLEDERAARDEGSTT